MILGSTGLDVSGICFGGNVFGWTADESTSRAILDAYAEAGGNFIDTANSYVIEHGASEAIIGRWLAGRPDRDRFVVATKVGGGPRSSPLRNLRADTIQAEAEASARRLRVDRIDLFYAHYDDPGTPLEESLRAFDQLVESGLVRHLGASNYSPGRLAEALRLQRELGLAPFTVFQPEYNLVERDYETSLRPIVEEFGMVTVPYYALANGFLTGKYRAGSDQVDSVRAGHASRYLERGGAEVLAALDDVAAAHSTTLPAVAIAWLRSRPTVAVPIASARNLEQLEQLMPGATLDLNADELELLTNAGAAMTKGA